MPSVTYGYEIRDGMYCKHPTNAAKVKKVFDLYRKGLSLKGTAQMMNQQGISYRDEIPEWDHNIVKRILQNRKYIGDDRYPCIVPADEFQAVQNIIASKSGGTERKRKTSADVIWRYLTCGACGRVLTQVDVRNPNKEWAVLKCKACGIEFRLNKRVLEQDILCRLNAHQQPENGKYEPNKEVLKLERMIDRGLEQPDHPGEVIAAILKGVSARYACCQMESAEQKKISRLTEMTPQHFGKTVFSIKLSSENEITVCFTD